MSALQPAAVRALIENNRCSPALFCELIGGIPASERDAWVDLLLGLDGIPEDGPELPRQCVPYLPCAVDALLRVVEHAPVGSADVFVDVGSGVGRAAALVHLLTGAPAIGVEVQPALVSASRALAVRLRLPGLSFVQGDAADVIPRMAAGSVFLLYCPFSGDRLTRLLANVEPLARARPIRVCCVDLPLAPCRWLDLALPRFQDLSIYRSIGAPRPADVVTST